MHIRATYSIITLLLAILMAGCSVSKDRFRLNGKFKNLHTAEIYIYSEEGRDTIRIQGGKFVYEKKLSRPMILTIQYPNFAEMKIVAEPGKETKFVTDASDLTQTKLSGSDENKLLSDFYYNINDKRGAEIKNSAETFIRKNPTTLAAEAVFRTYFAEADNIDAKRTHSLLNILLKSQPRNASLSRLAGKLIPFLKTTPGNKLPPFTVTSWKGETVTDKDFRGRYLLIYFWASWQYESFQQVRGLKNIVSPYSDRLGLVCVSLDYNYRTFLNNVRRDSLREHNVCDKLAWSSPIVKQLGVNYIPGNVIVSPEGEIVARDLEFSELRRRISELMKKQ